MGTPEGGFMAGFRNMFRRAKPANVAEPASVIVADPLAVPAEPPVQEPLGRELAESLASLKRTIEADTQKQDSDNLLDRWKARGEAASSEPEKPKLPAKVIQFPLFPEEKRPVSNDMARSALFSCVQGKDRQMLDDVLLATVDGVEIRFSGKQFNQDDHDVLMQLVHMAKHKPLGEYVTIPAYAILKSLGRKTDGRAHERLRADIMRLVNAGVSLRDTSLKVEYIGHLIDDAAQDENSRHWVYKFNPKLKALYANSTHTLIDWEQRLDLKSKDLARWLHLYFSTHAAPFPVKVATLKELSGSRTGELKKFRQLLRGALDDLKTVAAIEAWEIDQNDLVHVNRGKAISDSQRRHLTKPKCPPK